ncbi:hypothetical protein AACH06_14660 [Ideonella sp. DXS29W]|uniref:Alpha/beta hydrolase n=1 Tax=Ideonella lacteola TaxID=2984193 RepID=A0ABU9BQ22_9BURK
MPLHRHVFFIAGFDPKSPRYYHRLYRELAAHRPPGAEGTEHGPVQVGERRRLNDWADEWEVHWPQAGAAPLRTRYTLLRWDDIVRAHWERTAANVWRDHWNFYVDGARQGFFGRAWRASRLNWFFIVFPLCLALLLAGCWAVAAWLLCAIVAVPTPVGSVAVGVASALAGWWTWRRLSHRTGTDWLMRLYGFSHAQAAGRVATLDVRVDAMASMMAEAMRTNAPAQEVLVVGHSTGATLAASALSRALALSPSPGPQGPALGLLTLGHCTPLVYYFATARILRNELDALTDHPDLTWVDYTAPADWAGCGQIDPWHRPGRARLQRLSPRFPKILTAGHYQSLKRNRLALHMQYLKPSDHAGRYDLLAFTAGPGTLRGRHPPAPAASPHSS